VPVREAPAIVAGPRPNGYSRGSNDMKMLTALAFAPALLALSAAAQSATCVYPQAPQALPNGATASKEEMLAAQALVKDYAKNVQEVYLPLPDQGPGGAGRGARSVRPGAGREKGLGRDDPRQEAQFRAR
jgi:hypothetical protein